MQHHWGGGTPTYFEPAQLADLFAAISRHFDLDPRGEIAIEVDPRATTLEHVDTLRSLGFNRLSLGVQDFTERVQEAINRRQPGRIRAACCTRARPGSNRSTST